MSKISELSDGGVIQGGDTLIAVRSGGNVKVTYGGSTTANIDGGTIDNTVIGGTTPAAGNFTTANTGGLIVKKTSARHISLDLDTRSDGNGSVVCRESSANNLRNLDIEGQQIQLATNSFDQSQSIPRIRVATNGDVLFYEDTGTNAKLFFDASAERLGIGTTSPEGALSVSNGGAEGVEIDYTGGTMRIVSFDRTAVTDSSLEYRASEHVFKVSTSEKMRIDSVGRVGIGTTSPAYRLGVATTATNIANFDTTGTTAGLITFSDANTAASNTVRLGSVGNDLAFYTNTTGAGSERMRIDSSGDVIIGTQSQGGDRILSLRGNSAVLGYDSSATAAVIQSGNVKDLKFCTGTDTFGDNEAMRIDSSGRVGIGTTSPAQKLHVNSGVFNEVARFESSDATAFISLQDNTTSNDLHGIGATGDALQLFSNNSERMRIDSSGKVGIGTNSPSSLLHVASNGEAKVTIEGDLNNDAGEEAALLEFISDGNAVHHVIGQEQGSINDLSIMAGEGALTTIACSLVFKTKPTGTTTSVEAMRIDSSRNLLVGTTSSALYSSSSATGVNLKPNGASAIVRDGGTVFYLNRLTSDGAIADFRKDGTSVGSIGSFASDITLGKAACGLRFEDGTQTIRPHSLTTNSSNDGNVTLGNTDSRFEDLYLSGGVFLGGTATANKLDDYEEGTFTPSFNGGDYTFTYNKQKGSYTKIGNRVFVDMMLNIDASTAPSGSTDGNLFVAGLPFTFNAQNSVDILAVSIGFKQEILNAEDSLSIRFVSGNTQFSIHKDLSTGFPDTTLLQASDLAANSRLRIQFSYPTNS